MRADDPKLKRLEPPRLKPGEKFFLPQIAEGLGVTARHIAGVVFGNKAITMQYPEEQHVPSPNYRGVHRLNKDEHGRVKCVACMLCATACPAHCIDIVGATAPDTWPDREKYPESFVIDELRCIYCGMCEEACPVEAIELTGLYDLTGLSREQMIFDKTKLLSVFDADQGRRSRCGTASRRPSTPRKPRSCRPWNDLRNPSWDGGTSRPIRERACSPRKESSITMSIGDAILATLVVVLGAAGTYLDAAAPARHGEAAAEYGAGAIAGEPGAAGVPQLLEPARARSWPTRVLLRLQRGRHRSAGCLTVTSRNPIYSALWFASVVLSTVGPLPAGRGPVPGGRHGHRLRRRHHRHLPVRDHAGPDGRQGPLRPRGPGPGRATFTCFLLFWCLIYALSALKPQSTPARRQGDRSTGAGRRLHRGREIRRSL